MGTPTGVSAERSLGRNGPGWMQGPSSKGFSLKKPPSPALGPTMASGKTSLGHPQGGVAVATPTGVTTGLSPGRNGSGLVQGSSTKGISVEKPTSPAREPTSVGFPIGGVTAAAPTGATPERSLAWFEYLAHPRGDEGPSTGGISNEKPSSPHRLGDATARTPTGAAERNPVSIGLGEGLLTKGFSQEKPPCPAPFVVPLAAGWSACNYGEVCSVCTASRQTALMKCPLGCP